MTLKKVHRRSLDTISSPLNQLEFPLNRTMFLEEQFDVAEKYKDKNECRRMKLRFHVVLERRRRKYIH